MAGGAFCMRIKGVPFCMTDGALPSWFAIWFPTAEAASYHNIIFQAINLIMQYSITGHNFII
jgi:hypothetical protein